MMRSFTSSHWGVYETVQENGVVRLQPFDRDPDPSPIGLSVADAASGSRRIVRPAVRQGWLSRQRARQADPTQAVSEEAVRADRELRGSEPFIEVSWEEALDLVAGALRETISTRGNDAIFGGSYGWSSAGRFHHAQSQVHRFLNAIGGHVRHVGNYSFGAAAVILPHVIAPMEELIAEHTSWDQLAEHCQLFVSFGGMPLRNAQVSAGGASEHGVKRGIENMRAAGVRFVNVSPDASDLGAVGQGTWIGIRPGSDTALMLALAYTLVDEGLHDTAFLDRYCTGFNRFLPYLLGVSDGTPKTPAWAAVLTGIDAGVIKALARDMAASRTMVNMAWSLQRAQHGEQPCWMLVTLCAMLGQIGLPGGGFGIGYGSMNMMGNAVPRFSGPTLPQGRNPVPDFIPVARLADLFEKPGETFAYNGATHRYPDIRLVYWAGGNPFHHHQDLNRLKAAWRRPDTVIVHEQFWTATARMADIVLPATTSLERDDIGYATRERFMIAMKQAMAPVGEARDDYAIFAELAARLGDNDAYTEGRTPMDWLEVLYDAGRLRAATAGVSLPPFDVFWKEGIVDIAPDVAPVIMFERFRADPQACALATPSGRIELFSERIAGFDLPDCPGHAAWIEPSEWMASADTARHPLHLLSNQPANKLHSQYDHGALSLASKVKGREVVMLSRQDADARGLVDGDVVRVHNDRGECLAAVRITDDLLSGVIKIATGAWFDPSTWAGGPSLEKHGNPNVLTLDVGASSLSQGCTAQTCMVEVSAYPHGAPAVTAHDGPQLLRRLA